MTGRVKHYSSKQGYGFISSKKGDIFFHHSDLESRNCLKAGDTVSYDPLRTDRGYVAKRVKVLL